MSSTWGKNLKVSIFGESHGKGIGAIIDGLPSGIAIDTDFILSMQQRRRARSDGMTTARHEGDEPLILSGLLGGKTEGTPLCAVFYNNDVRSSDYESTVLRPSHADYTSLLRYGGYADRSGGGHFSGRLTAPLVFAGAVADSVLQTLGIRIISHISRLHGVCDAPLPDRFDEALYKRLKSDGFPVINGDAKEKMLAEIALAAKAGDSVGGTAECAVYGVSGGIGNPMFDTVEGAISSLCFAIPGVKGVAFGGGFEMCDLFGSSANDEFSTDGNNICTVENKSGGIQGGITNGNTVVFRTAFKPTPSIAKKQNSVDTAIMQNVTSTVKGRHDPCILSRAAVTVEAAAAIALLDCILSTPDNAKFKS